MNEIFEFRKELNIKKILILSLISIFIIAIIIFGISKKSTEKEEEKIEASNPNFIFYDSNKTISLTLPKTYGFVQYKPSSNYILELRTAKNLNIFVSQNDSLENKSLKDIASSDIKVYINEFKQYSNLSEINEFDINGNKAYSYCLHYLDSKTPYYLQVIWLQGNNKYYTIDIEFPLEDLNNYTNIINDATNSFIIY